MPSVNIGEFKLSRIVDTVQPMALATSFFPEMTDDMLAEVRANIPTGHLTRDGRVIFSFHSYVVQTDRMNILIDTCCGNDKLRPSRPEFTNKKTDYLETLAKAGLRPEDINYVMCTHLHWDHVGWNTRLVNGQWVPTFPNAKYVMAKREYDFWDKAYASGEASIHSDGFVDSVLPIMRAKQAVLVADDYELDDGIWLEPCHGHSAGHVVVNLESQGARGAVTGDVIHHLAQLRFPNLSTSVDTDMELARTNRRALIDKHAGAGTLICAGHFSAPSVGRIEKDRNAFKFDGVY